MLSFLARRIAQAAATVLASTFLIFLAVSSTGDPLAQLRTLPGASQQTVESIVEEKRLLSPVVVRYGHWLEDVATDGFGTTLLGNRSIWPELRRALGTTLQLVLPALVIAAVAGTAIGLWSAARTGSAFDRGATLLVLLSFSLPEFWLAVVLQALVSEAHSAWDVRLLYATGLQSTDPANPLVDRIQHLVLPVLVLALPSIAVLSRYARAAASEVVGAPFVSAALARGLSRRRVLFGYVLRAAAAPLVAIAAIDVGRLLAGAVVVETVFAIDGMGRYFLDALSDRDVYPLMAWLTVTATIVVLANLAADVFHAYVDPRVRHA